MNDFNFNTILLIVIASILGIFLLLFFIWLLYYTYRYFNFRVAKNKKNTRKGSNFYIEEILTAIDFFSRKKIGALIVFQRKVILTKFLTEVGIALDANLTSDLLKAIFAYKKTQLHDGAVIINKQWKIQSASVFLPLPKKAKSIKKFGTRHSAGYAIVSQTDAVACVVSENNGRIHFIQNKKDMWLVDKVEDLRSYLKQELYYD